MRTKLWSILAAGVVVGCGGPAADPAPVWGSVGVAASAPAADLTIWPADAELRAWVLTVAPRIEAATGLVVVISDEAMGAEGGVPMFWSPRGEAEGWLGLCGGGEWIALDPGVPMAVRETVVLHEVLHALGAAHVDSGAGVLSPQIWARPEGWLLTDVDLMSVCAVRDCAHMTAEK